MQLFCFRVPDVAARRRPDVDVDDDLHVHRGPVVPDDVATVKLMDGHHRAVL